MIFKVPFCFTAAPLQHCTTMNCMKCALKIIGPALSYSEAPQFLNLKTLDRRCNELCVKALAKISRGGPLVKHLPMTSQHMHHYQTKGANKYTT